MVGKREPAASGWAVDELKRQTREGVPIGDILRLCKWVMLPPRQRFLEILESMGGHREFAMRPEGAGR